MIAEMPGAATSVVEGAEWMVVSEGGYGEALWTGYGVGERRNLAAQTGCQEGLASVCLSEWGQASL